MTVVGHFLLFATVKELGKSVKRGKKVTGSYFVDHRSTRFAANFIGCFPAVTKNN